MAYFTGPLLDRKVAEYDLGVVDTAFEAVAAGYDDAWPPGGYIVPAQPTILEATRIVLYSMLHNYHLKSRFVVRVSYEESVIKVDIKAPARRDVAAGSASIKRRGGAPSPAYHASLQDIPPKPEDLSNCFTDDISFDSPASAKGEK